MKYLLAIMIAVIAMLSKFATVVFGFTNMDPTTASFSATSMEPEYADGGSAQFFTKLVRNTGYNFHYCTDILPHRRISISGQSFTSGQELSFDTDHNWNGARIGVIVTPGASYWDGGQYSSRVARTIGLTDAYQEMYLYDDGDPQLSFDIKYVGAAGFKIRNNIAATRTLNCIIIRGNLHTGA